ncbi:MAG: EexN family lipoprotein [Azoarcus sp.]|nr:EexN family lipoprotein [Azoarcus sp.]
MKYSVCALAAVSLLALAGCQEEKRAEEVRTVDWYVEHTDDLNAKLQECRNNPGELEGTPNCKNAHQAERQKFTNSIGSGKGIFD